MTTRTTTVRRRLAALAACSLFATVLPFSALAEQGIPAGSGAVITAGGSLPVRVAPGWDAEISYEIADGSYVTVWDVAQAAPDGSLWYPVDGGFVPVDTVTSTATLDSGFQYFQDTSSADWTEPAATQGWVDPNTGEWVDPSASQTGWVDPTTGEWVDPAATQGWVDPNTGEWIDPNATQGWIDPNTGEWVDPAATQTGWVDPNTGEWVDASATQTGWVDPNTGEWVDPNATQSGWVDPTTGEWVDPAATQGWVDPNTGAWVDPNAAQGWIDPATGEWVDGVALAQDAAVPVSEDLVASATDTAYEAAPVATDGVDPNAAAPVDAAPADGGWVDPNTGEWVEAAPADAAPVTDTWTETAPTDATTDAAGEEWVEPAPVDAAASGDSYSEPIGTAYIAGTNGDGVACRAAAERGADKLAVLGEGEAVEVRGEAVGEWQPVNCAGMGGYVNSSFISWEPAAAPADSGRRNRSNGGASGGSASGQAMADFAMQYVGYPYVYAGAGPYAFDCSGLTMFVAQNVLGINITHDMFQQIQMGTPVSRDELQPGDLVFFANTFRPGLSHAGVYIGGGQFVNAQNESTGVVVSDLNSDYYGSRWYGATRLA